MVNSSIGEMKKMLDPFALNQPEDDSNDCDYKQNVNDATGTVSKKSDQPSDDQDDSDDIK
jgi:hypothetical protein